MTGDAGRGGGGGDPGIASDEHDKGDFERLMLRGFETDRTYAEQSPRCGGGWTGLTSREPTSGWTWWPGTDSL